MHEVVAERFVLEQSQLHPLPATRYDTSYRELRQVSWDAYIEVRGNRYSVPDTLAGRRVSIRISLEGSCPSLTRIDWSRSTPSDLRTDGWVTVPEHHRAIWQALQVEQRPLAQYEEVAAWS